MADLSHLSDDQLAQIAGQTNSAGPNLSHMSDDDLDKIANPSVGHAISKGYQASGIVGAIKEGASQLVTNAKVASNYNPSEEEKMNAAKNPITGMEDPAYVYGAGLVSETSALKGLGNLIKSGKAKITGLFSSEEGLHPIIEAADEASPLNPFKEDIFSMRASREGMKPTLPDLRAARVAEAAPKLNLNLNPLKMNEPLFPPSVTQAAPEVAETAAETSHGGVANLLHHLHVPTSANAAGTLAGGYVGGKVAEEAGIPKEYGYLAGAAVGSKAGPMAVRAYLKTANGLLPIIEAHGAALNAAARAAIAKEGTQGEDNANK